MKTFTAVTGPKTDLWLVRTVGAGALLTLDGRLLKALEQNALITRAIPSSGEKLPVVALTADVTEAQHIRCLAAGMNDIVTKPIDPDPRLP